MTDGQDHGKRLEKIELIDTLLEYASDIVADIRHAEDQQSDTKEKELLSLVFQILSLLSSIRNENICEYFSDINPRSLGKKYVNENEAEIIRLDRRKPGGERRKRHVYIANDRRIAFSDRRKNPSV
jgi:hypothetical protein